VNEINLQCLTKLSICQALLTAINQRQVGSGRIHAIFLLIKKVLVFLSSQESTRLRQFILPSSYESYCYVDNICGDSSQKRKQESRNRIVLGVQSCQQLMNQRATSSSSTFIIPPTWSPVNDSSEPIPSVSASSPSSFSSFSLLPKGATGAASPTSTSTTPLKMESLNNLTKEELKEIATGCIRYLQQQVTASEHELAPARISASASSSSSSSSALASSSSSSSLSVREVKQQDRTFMMYLATAILSFIAPRTQVLRQLRIGSSLVKEEDGRYWVKILADLSKNGKPTLFTIPDQLTKSFDLYIKIIRPRLLQTAIGRTTKLKNDKFVDHNYMFFNNNGREPRTEFVTYTNVVTQQLIGRAVNPHAFRSAVIQAFYETGATQNDMDLLARIMSHSSNTAKDFYYRPKMTEAAIQTNQRIAEFLLK
jgi:hypothetical protein